MNKPILCFHIGYIPDINDINTKTTYGSEIALINLSKLFADRYQVFIFGHEISNEITKNEIKYLNSDKFKDFQKNNIIDIMIISRYTFYFIDTEITARKTFFWLHDNFPISYYDGIPIPNLSKGLLQNVIDKIDGIITLTNWHKNNFIEYYEINPNKIFIIGNGIDVKLFKNKVKKQKNKFIWTSHGGRGMHKMLEYFHEIRKKIPDAELYVYRDQTAFLGHLLDEMKRCEYIHYGGKIDNKKIIEEFESSEFWFYPTNFEESYCISALEAQMAKCVCITTHLGALIETIGDRGVLIKEPIWSKEYKERSINEVIKILNDKKLKNKYQKTGYEWAKNQTWEKRAEQWYELFK